MIDINDTLTLIFFEPKIRSEKFLLPRTITNILKII